MSLLPLQHRAEYAILHVAQLVPVIAPAHDPNKPPCCAGACKQ
jgi:hypothetical protein